MKTVLYNDDCLKVLKTLPQLSVDLVLTDLPYGTTACPWDSIIPLPPLWRELSAVSHLKTAFVFTAQQPFTTTLIESNFPWFRYCLVWKKPNATNPYQAKSMPMKAHEDIVVFYQKQPTYNPQMREGKPYKWNSKRSGGEAGSIKQTRETPIDNTGTRFPISVLEFAQERGLHPTQKPVPLMEYLIKTYTNEGDTVLDCCMGSGTTGIACINTDRNFIGIEKDKKIFKVAEKRIIEAPPRLNLI
jgi:site-specific DNA-methyltransferase (adenine-specific)